MSELYGWTRDGEVYYGRHASRAHAIEAARARHKEDIGEDPLPTDTVTTCRCVFKNPAEFVKHVFYGEDIAAKLEENANEEGLGGQDDCLWEIDHDKLEAAMEDALREYLRKLDPKQNFYGVDDERDHKFGDTVVD